MSFSFNVRGATIALALAAVAAKLDEVVVQQPAHAADRAQIDAVVDSHAKLLAPTEDHDIVISVSGSISTREGDGGERLITGVNVSVGAYWQQREPQAVESEGGEA